MSLSVHNKMEVFLYNSTICRLCGEENDNGTLLYSTEENSQNLSEVINNYLPIKVSDDGQLPQTICPGCTIQLEATVEFMNLIINGQKIIRDLHHREKEYKKSLLNNESEQEVITEKIVYEVNTSDGVYQVEHPIALQVAGLEKPKRKRGRPPKKLKSPEELAAEQANREKEVKAAKKKDRDDEPSGKRKRKAPTRFKEAVQGKELEKIFIEEGVIDEESDHDVKPEINIEPKIPVSKEPEIIGHMENSGELVVVVKGKGRGRPKGRMRGVVSSCAICGMQFSCAGRYMSHVAAHGPVAYRCGCGVAFRAKLHFDNHQRELGHDGFTVLPRRNNEHIVLADDDIKEQSVEKQEVDPIANDTPVTTTTSLPDLNPQPATKTEDSNTVLITLQDEIKHSSSPLEITNPSSPANDGDVKNIEASSDVVIMEETNEIDVEEGTPGKERLKCNHCDKTFSSKQSKSLHIKATHQGSRPYACKECGLQFAYPRSLALHAVSHRRRTPGTKGFACDLCGKVLNHPSSVVYHKEAEHAGQRYVCGKCGKLFKHKQLLQRHQLVHSALRPYTCKTCNASFKTKANLLNHQLLHSGVKKFSCEICKHRFAHKTSLTLHMRWHTGQKPYSCETCGKSFSQKGNLSEHERIHTGEKPFQCTLCPRRFTTSSQHRLHARRHQPHQHQHQPHQPTRSGTRAAGRRAGAGAGGAGAGAGAGAGSGAGSAGAVHVCGWCGRELGSRWALLKHARQHTGERPFRCPHCPRAFADASNLNKHKKQVHKQVSLLANSNQPGEQQPEPQPQPQPRPHPQPKLAAVEITAEDELEERIIYVTYDVDEPHSPPFHILQPEQTADLDETKVLTTCELYSGPSLLVPQPAHPQLEMQHDHHQQLEHDTLDQMHEPIVIDAEQMPVTDEQGNPLHFTMQDGTRLAITSADGKSLQVITQDGQTIPVEINGYAEEEEVENADTIVHQLNLQKSVEATVSAPVTHYFTIV